jgi:hypothetical protein
MNSVVKVALALAFAAGCQEAPVEQSASDTVHSFFAAITARDCTTLGALAGGKVAAELQKLGCNGLVDGYGELGLKLVGINDVVEDGRDRDARIVHAMIGYTGRAPREMLLRVERKHGHWLVVSI